MDALGTGQADEPESQATWTAQQFCANREYFKPHSRDPGRPIVKIGMPHANLRQGLGTQRDDQTKFIQ